MPDIPSTDAALNFIAAALGLAVLCTACAAKVLGEWSTWRR